MLQTQNAHLSVTDPAQVAHNLLQELQGVNPFNLLNHSLWYLVGLGGVLLIMFCTFSLVCQKLRARLFRTQVKLPRVQSEKRRAGDVEGQHVTCAAAGVGSRPRVQHSCPRSQKTA